LQVGLYYEGDEVVFRLDADDLSRAFPRFVGRLGEGSVVTPDLPEPGDTSSVAFTNSSKGTDPNKPGWWVVSIREGPSSDDCDRIHFLEPGETAVAEDRNEPGDRLWLNDGGCVALSAGVVVEGAIDALPVVFVPSATGQ